MDNTSLATHRLLLKGLNICLELKADIAVLVNERMDSNGKKEKTIRAIGGGNSSKIEDPIKLTDEEKTEIGEMVGEALEENFVNCVAEIEKLLVFRTIVSKNLGVTVRYVF